MTRHGLQGAFDSLGNDPIIMKPDILFIPQQEVTFHFPYNKIQKSFFLLLFVYVYVQNIDEIIEYLFIHFNLVTLFYIYV